jgi:protein TonB
VVKIARPGIDLSRIVYVNLGVVCLHLVVLWLVQVGAQPIAPVIPTFSIQLPVLPQSNSTPPTTPATVAHLPRHKPKPPTAVLSTLIDMPLPSKADSVVTSPELPSSPTAAPLPAPSKSGLGAIHANSATDSVASSLQLPSSVADYLNNPAPVYPAISQRLGEQGKVVVHLLITKDGSARQGEIHQSSGFERLDQAALRAVMSWRYVPGQRAGVPQDMWFNVPINFALK